ncbi:hypothetical protein PN498_15990 [Oscillatoria sp. CS-180]|uniref:hypothetical protein n=1 Tax=Oscillatoria sp. CS-180 TaxID=3021720 RepID=UPI00232BC72E|nr:hypothetical protein [Oscillatoria sp. CS-180]MDB9527499.1 hypothetical protein [Oscillatoria sp. CS-180]
MADEKANDLFRQESLERLSSPERLDELMTIVNLRTWLPLGALCLLLGIGLIWSWIGRIPITTNGRGMLVQDEQDTGHLVALLHFDNRYRGQFRPGMPVVLTPETLLIYNEPGLQAEIVEVLESPALTLEQARQVELESETREDGRLEVLAQLSPMDSAMPPNTIVAGVRVQGRITLEERAPIAFVFPFLDR